jgi:hypothetical protein
MRDRLRAFAGAFFRVRARRQSKRFFQSTLNCQATQHEVLRQLLTLNESSDFSRERGLVSTLTASEFRSRMPVSRFADYEPYIERLKIGQQQAMLGPNNRLLMFALTSGTTSRSKFIPITQRFLNDYRRGWQIWGIHNYDTRPGLNHKNILQVTSDFHQFQTAGGTPCGNISGLAVASQRRVVRFMYTIPFVVSKISDSAARYYTIVRLGLADDNIGLILTANPSTVLQLVTVADAEKETLIKDIFDGTLSERFSVSPEIRDLLRRRIARPRRNRARALESIVTSTGTLALLQAWPRLEQLAVWTGGSCGAYLPLVRQHFGPLLPIRDHGLSASEGRMTIPFEDGRSDGVLDVSSHYFEFIPENEYGSASPTVLEAHELQPDSNYYILMTTSSGFYRYDICDVVRCVGFVHTTPILRFLHKGAHIANLTGEKITESQVVDAMKQVSRTMGLNVSYFTFAPAWGEPPYYQLFLEARDAPAGESITQLASSVDRTLCELNREYHEKRLTQRLAGLRVTQLRDGAWKQFAIARQIQSGGSAEQYKHPCLIPDHEVAQRTLGEWVVR